ncbi:signal peptidase II [Qipengyuania atrilutea]|uniref:Lipoprotein signal peptidase n=1 Tax=Qipengyuania atrilutea TaxID=2744473 RepID=A0A850H5K4_9SPHN|nr:signal peptidase II [Actirhodobacter atriluteus]NVD45133.1 signal peptidase II [Actirhodobacter atriluteus]
MTPVKRNRLIGLALAFAIFAVDQLVKWYVSGPLQLRQRGLIELIPFFDLRWTENYGVSMGMFEATSMEMRWVLVLVTAAIAGVVTIWMLREKLIGDILGLSLILGGALGNIKDRYELGYVIDYADLHFGDFRPFFIFNLADAAITIGVVIILARAFFVSEKDDTSAKGKPSQAVPTGTEN